MKEVMAIIRSREFEVIKDALAAAEILGITVTHVLGFGHQKENTQIYREHEITSHLLRKIMLEIVTTDEKVEEVIDIIVNTARTGQVGDGRIFVHNINEVVSISTGEQGERAV